MPDRSIQASSSDSGCTSGVSASRSIPLGTEGAPDLPVWDTESYLDIVVVAIVSSVAALAAVILIGGLVGSF